MGSRIIPRATCCIAVVSVGVCAAGTGRAADLPQIAQTAQSYVKSEQLVSQNDSAEASAPPRASSATAKNLSDTAETQELPRLGEVVVMARRREEDAQTVPIAITVLSQQALQENNVQELIDLQSLVPSMSSTSGLTRNAVDISIRGQSFDGISGQAAVVTFLNEVPIPDFGGELAGGPGLLFDLENVQVLKGPQGTLFGKNTVGGDILLQTARPTSELGGRLQLGYGNYNDREVDGAINVPIVNDVLLTRVAFNGQLRDGFTHVLGAPNYPNGTDADNRDNYGLRATVTFRPNDRFQNEVIATYTDYHSRGSPLILALENPSGGLFSSPSYLALFAQQQALGIRTAIPVDTPLVDNGRLFSLNNLTRVSLGDNLRLRNIVGYVVANQTLALDNDMTNLGLLNNPSTPRDFNKAQITEEPQLLGNNFGGALDWVAGGFYMDQRPRSTPSTALVLNTIELDAITRASQKSRAVYTQGTYDWSALIPGLRITVGARYTWDNIFTDSLGGQFGSKCTPPTVNCGPSTESVADAKSSALSWTAGADYRVTGGTLLYLTASRGYRPGGANAIQDNGRHIPFGPEYVTNYEIGAKSDWNIASIPIRTNADVYYQNYTDIQAQEFVVLPSSAGIAVGITSNAARARLWGAELEATAKLTNDLELGLAYDSLSFDYTQFGSGVNADQLNATKRLNRPPSKYSVNARYRLPLRPDVGDISVRLHWSWQATYNGDTSQPGALVNAYGLLNINADWNDIFGRSFDASLFASNLTNKVYVAGTSEAYAALGFAGQRYGEPRMYGIRLRYRFGSGGNK